MADASYDANTIAVYHAALLDAELIEPNLQVVIAERTTDWNLDQLGPADYLAEHFSMLTPGTVTAFVCSLRERACHRGFGDLGTTYAVLGDVERTQLTHDGRFDFELFFKRYEKTRGIVTLSRVTFSEDGQWAVVYISLTTGSMGGFGDVYLYLRTEGDWKNAGRCSVWVA